MNKIKIGTFLFRIGFVIYILENFYFGWNKTPMSDMELYADNVVRFCFYAGFVFYFMPLWSLYESFVKKHEQ